MNEWWALVSLAGLWGWILSVILFILKAFPRNGQFDKAGLRWGLISVVAFGVWILGMTQA